MSKSKKRVSLIKLLNKWHIADSKAHTLSLKKKITQQESTKFTNGKEKYIERNSPDGRWWFKINGESYRNYPVDLFSKKDNKKIKIPAELREDDIDDFSVLLQSIEVNQSIDKNDE